MLENPFKPQAHRIKPLATTLNIFGDLLLPDFIKQFTSSRSDDLVDDYYSPRAKDEILNKRFSGSKKTSHLLVPIQELSEILKKNQSSLGDAATIFKTYQPSNLADSDEVQAKYNDLIKAHAEVGDEVLKQLDTLSEFLKEKSRDIRFQNPKAVVEYVKEKSEFFLKNLSAQKKILDDASALPDNAKQCITKYYANIEASIKSALEGTQPSEVDKESVAVEGLNSRLDNAVEIADIEVINFNILNEHTLSKFPKTENKVDPNRYLELDYKSFLNMPLDPSTRTYYQWLFQTKTDNLKTSSGLILKNNNGTLSFSLPVNALHPINKLWDLVVGNPMFYHNSANNLLLNDFLLVMNQLKAQGFKSCTISINVDDPKLRDRMMQDAYAAARLAGFPDNKITFNIPDPPENKNPIENKTAAELGGQLNNGRQRAESRLAAWEKQKQDLEKDQKPVIDNQVTEIARAIAEKLNPDETIEANTALNISRSPRLS